MVTIEINGSPVTVQGIDAERIVGSKKFKDWVKDLDLELNFRNITISYALFTKEWQDLLFAILTCDVIDRIGRKLPGVVFLRGPAIAVFVVIRVKESKDLYTVLVRQGRVPAGSASFLEIPAGMLETDPNRYGAAFRELYEETGILVGPDDIVSLYDGLYTSPGGSDEVIYLYFTMVEMTEKELNELRIRVTGVASENEHISLVVVPFESFMEYTNDMKSLLAYFLVREILKA